MPNSNVVHLGKKKIVTHNILPATTTTHTPPTKDLVLWLYGFGFGFGQLIQFQGKVIWGFRLKIWKWEAR